MSAPTSASDLQAVGDHMQSEASRLAEWARGQWDTMPYEAQMALVGLSSALDDWTNLRRRGSVA